MDGANTTETTAIPVPPMPSTPPSSAGETTLQGRGSVRNTSSRHGRKLSRGSTAHGRPSLSPFDNADPLSTIQSRTETIKIVKRKSYNLDDYFVSLLQCRSCLFLSVRTNSSHPSLGLLILTGIHACHTGCDSMARSCLSSSSPSSLWRAGPR